MTGKAVICLQDILRRRPAQAFHFFAPVPVCFKTGTAIQLRPNDGHITPHRSPSLGIRRPENSHCGKAQKCRKMADTRIVSDKTAACFESQGKLREIVHPIYNAVVFVLLKKL